LSYTPTFGFVSELISVARDQR